MKKRKDIIVISVLIFLSIILSFITCTYITLLENVKPENQRFITYIFNNINITKFTILSLIYITIFLIIYVKRKIVFDYIYKYRFLIASLVFLLCVLFEINGSSIGMWRYCIGSDLTGTGDVVGTARVIRGDEWVVFTPFAVSQNENKPDKYSYFSNTIRGDKTDVYIVYGQPVKDISIIFRPFQVGYLLLGTSRGLSFYWCGRFIALFLVAFELSMLITKNRKDISLITAFLITLAPAIQWWFSVNGLVEMIVFGGLSILLLQKYMVTENFWKRLLYLCIISICGGGYILTFYPAWEVPMAYVFLGLAIWVIIENRKGCKIKIKDIISILVFSLITLGLLANIYIKSKDTINLVMNTAYPGARCEIGGKMGLKYFSYPANLFFTLDQDDLGTNVCEAAVFFDLFPLGFILAVIVLFKQKQKDKLLIIFLILSGLFAIWEVFGLPTILAKLTLLYVSPARRTFIIVGFLNVLVLARAMALVDKSKLEMFEKIIIAILVSVISIKLFPDYFEYKKIIITFIAMVSLYISILKICEEKLKEIFVGFICIVMMFTGFLVNPIRRGIDVITEQPVGKEIKSIQEQEPGLWIVEGMGYPMFNFPIMYGAPTINSTNVYPDLERWKILDPEGKYEEIYNRYAHIVVEFTNEEEEARFELLVTDSFKLYLPINKLKDLNVKHILTSKDLNEYSSDTVIFNKKYSNYGVWIYDVEFK